MIAALLCALSSCSPHGSSTPAPSPRPTSATPAPGSKGAASSALFRPLHFPSAQGKRCPASAGHYVQTADFGSMTLGSGVVRVGIAGAGRPGTGFHPAAFHGWLAVKSHFFSYPRYRGPFLVRARSLRRGGRIRLGATPSQAGRLLVPSGSGWREQPDFTFVGSPGCYGWQIDGTTFSYVVVVRILRKYRAPT